MTSRQGQNLPFSLQKLLNLMQSAASSKDRRTRRSSNRRFSFESIILVQAKQDLDDLLTRQMVPSPTQSSQSVENRENLLDEEVVESFLTISREFMPIVFQEKELMGINLLMFIIYASQKDVNVKLAEDGLDLILEWLRHHKVDGLCKVEIGSAVLARMLEQVSDDTVHMPLQRKIFLITVELCADIPENQNLVSRKIKNDGFSKLFQQSPDFMIQYCSIAMNSILSNSNVRDSGTKFCPGKMSKLFATLADVSNNDSVGLMNALVKWNREDGRLTWEGMISRLTVDNREYDIVAGPSISKSFLVALIQNGSRAPIFLLDIDLSRLCRLEIDRKHSRIKVFSQSERAAVGLDFRRIASSIMIDFSNLKDLGEVLKQLPTKLTETPDSQIELSQRGAILSEPIFIDNSKYRPKEVEHYAEDEVKMHVEGNVVEDQNIRNSPVEGNVSFDLSRISTPGGELSSSTAPRSSRRSVTKTYSRSKSRRFTCNPGRKKSDTRSAAAQSSASDTENDEDKVETSHEAQESQRTAYDSPPPGGDNKPRNRHREKTASAYASRKRNRDKDDEEYQPNKRSRVIKTPASKSVSLKEKEKSKRSSLPSKAVNKSDSNRNNRRNSAPVKRPQYGLVDSDIERLQDTERPDKRHSQVKSQLTFVSSGPLPSSVLQCKIPKENQVKKAITRQGSPPKMVDTSTKPNPASHESYDDGHSSGDVDKDRDYELYDETQIRVHPPSINHLRGNSLPSPPNILPEIKLKPLPTKHRPTLDIKYVATQKSDMAKPIALPGRRDTPIAIVSQKTSKLKEKDLLDAILEVHDESHLNCGNEFQLKRIYPVDEEEETWSQHNSPTPSHFKTGNLILNHGSGELCLPPGYTTTRSPNSPPRRLPLTTTTLPKRLVKSDTLQKQPPDLGSKSLAPILERQTSQQVDCISSRNHEQSTEHAMGRALYQEISPLGPKRGQTVDTFHSRLLKKGISFPTPEVIKNYQPEGLHTNDSDMSDDELVSDSDEEMQEDSGYPEHQQHVRDAFYEITEARPYVKPANSVYI